MSIRRPPAEPDERRMARGDFDDEPTLPMRLRRQTDVPTVPIPVQSLKETVES